MAYLKTILLLALAAVGTLAGLLVPAHLRSVDALALRAAADAAPASLDRLAESLRAGQIGPARFIADATGAEPAAPIAQRLSGRPTAALLGGPDPSFESFIQLLPASRYSAAAPQPVIPLLLPGGDRRLLAERLTGSTNSNATALLRIRELRGMLRLHPASHPAGAPFDAGILTLAQLIESGHIQPAWADQIGNLADTAGAGEPRAIEAIETLVMATLSLGRQLDFRSLANLANFTQSLGDWADLATLFRAHPNAIPELYTTLHFERASRPLFDYLSAHPESGMNDLRSALKLGPGAVTHLLHKALPLHQPKALARRVLGPLEAQRPAAFVELALLNRPAALSLKLLLLLTAGYAVALACGALWRGTSTSSGTISRLAPAVLARNLSLGIVLALTAWCIFEPEVLQSQTPAADAAPRLEFTVASALSSLQSPVKTMQNINEVTLLVLALFFILQLVIYCFCLIKLKEIARQNLSPDMKLKLLDNEENLFDFGLYVGLGGTVLSLILVAIGIVEASLMAAYASTLFGILFVAVLKVLHLRPYRRKLILEADS
ncbi:MAG: hypothetical protein ACFCU4_03930 [Puniceicoccaceae bacterium]